MKYLKLLSILFLILIASCGKSPLQLEKSKKAINESEGQAPLEASHVFKTTEQFITLSWLSPINSTDEGHLLIIAKKNGIASDVPESFSVDLWMPSMGHGSSPVVIKKLGTGIYDVSEVYFIMDGDWQLRLRLKNGSTLIEEIIFPYFL